jgi:hypothetical protein
MSRYAHIKLHITHHAHKQYCERVEAIKEDELKDKCLSQLKKSEYGHNKEWFIHLAGVWWVYDIKDDQMTFITCYGRSELDLPKALKWAKRHKDKIALVYTLSINT